MKLVGILIVLVGMVLVSPALAAQRSSPTRTRRRRSPTG